MNAFLSLDQLGQRICIVGPSNSGKSTLARAISVKTGLPVVHLDQLHHQPNSAWIPRPHEEFLRLHQEAIEGENWVMDGNYGKCIHSRLVHATGIILIDIPRFTALYRYIMRCYSTKPRVGGIGIQKEHLTGEMVKHILHDSPKSHQRYRELFEHAPIAKILLSSPREVAQFYDRWQL